MPKEKEPVFIARVADKKDLSKLNKKFYSDNKTKLKEKDLNRTIVTEINGKIRGMTFFDPKKQDFFQVTNDPIIKDIFGFGLAKYEVERKKKDKEMEKLIKKFGTKRVAEMYEEKMNELVKKLKKSKN